MTTDIMQTNLEEDITQIEWDQTEPGLYTSMCNNFTLHQDQLYSDVYVLCETATDDYVSDGFMDQMTALAQTMLDDLRAHKQTTA